MAIEKTLRTDQHECPSDGAARRSTPPVTVYARYVGRVGALAVALGVGAAVASGHGTGFARADAVGSADNTSVDAPSDAPAESAAETIGEPLDPGDGAGTAGSGDTENSAPDNGMQVDSSGGQDTSVNDEGQSTDDAAGDDASGEDGGDEDPAVVDSGADPAPAPASSAVPANHDSPPPRTAVVESPAPPSVSATTVSAEPPSEAAVGPAQAPVSVEKQWFSFIEPAAPEPDALVVAASEVQREPVSATVAATFVNTMLSPLFAPGPGTPVDPPMVLGLLAWVRSQEQRRYDVEGASLAATAALVNNTPTASNNAATTAEDTAVTINVLANDRDPDGDQLTPVIVTNPANGSVSVNPNGSVTYTPTANFNGTDTFTYSASDGTANSAPATVTVKVTAVNDAPVANPDFATTTEDTSVVINVKANDTDVENNTLTPQVLVHPVNGKVVRNADGTYTYTPKANFSGTDTFTYRLYDGKTSNPATVTITVNSVNDIPTAGNDSATTREDTPVTVNVLVNDKDGDGQILTPAVVTGPANGNVTVNPNGTLTYTPNLNFSGTDSFTYAAFDGAANSAPATVSVKVTAVNDVPIANPDTASTLVNTSVVIAVKANDLDPDDTNLIASVTTHPANGKVVRNSDGTYTYTPKANFVGTDTFSYRLYDGSATSAPTTVTVTVRPTNQPPVANSDSATVAEDSTSNIAVLANDVDNDGNSGINPASVTITQPAANGTATANPDGTVSYTPNADFHGTDSFRYTVADAAGAVSGIATVTITVTAVNDAPVAVDDAVFTFKDTPVTITPDQLLDNDSDAEGDALSAVLPVGSGPANGQLVTGPGGALTYIPNPGFTGTDTFTYRATDGVAMSNPATVSVTVAAIPMASVLGSVEVADAVLGVGPVFGPDGRALVTVKGLHPDTGQVMSTHLVVMDTATGERVNEGVHITLRQLEGDLVGPIEFNADHTRAFLTTRTEGDRTQFGVLDLSTGALIAAPVDLVGSPTQTVFTNNGTRAWIITDDTAGGPIESHRTTIALVDTTTGLLVGPAIVRNDTEPGFGPLFTPDGTRVVFTLHGTDPDTGQVENTFPIVVDAATGALISDTEPPVLHRIEGATADIEFNDAYTRAYVTTRTIGDRTGFGVLDMASGELIAVPVDIAGSPAGLVFTEDHSRVWIITDDTAGGSGPTDPERHAARLALVDTTTGALVGVPIVRNDAAPRLDPQFTPDGALALVAISGLQPDTGVVVDTDLYVIDLATGALRGADAPIDLEGNLTDIRYSPDNTRAYLTTVSEQLDRTYFTVVNLTTGAPVGEQPIEIDGSPISPTAINIVFTDDNTRAWILTDDTAGGTGPTNPISHRFILTLIDTPDAAVLGSVEVADAVLGVGPVFGPDGRALVTVKGLHPDTGQVMSTHLVVMDTATGERVNEGVHITLRQLEGDLVGPIEFNADHTRAFLTTRTEGDRTQFGVLDLSTGALIAAPVDLVGSPTQTVFTNNGTRAWIITDDTAGGPIESHRTTIALVDTTTGLLVGPAIVRNDTEPGFGPLFTPDGTRVVFTLHGTDPDTGQVENTFPIVVDAATGALISDTEPPVLHRIEGATADIEFNDAYTRAYVTTRTIGDRTGFGVLDMASGELIAVPVDIAGSPAGLVFTEDHSRVWIITDDTAGGSGPTDPERHAARLALVDTTTGALVGVPIVRNDAAPRLDPQFTPDGALALVAISGLQPDTGVVVDTDLYVIDLATGALRGADAPIDLEGNLTDIRYSPDNTRAYLTTVSEQLDRTYFTVVNLTTGAPVGEQPIEIDGSPISPTAINIVFTDDNTRAWILTDDTAGGTGPTNPISHRFILTLIDTGHQAGALQATVLAQPDSAESFSLMTALVNTPPTAANNSVTTAEDTAVIVNVLANDSDADGDPLTAQVVTGPANGNVTVNPNGSLTYNPHANFNGTDTFTYSAFDGTDASAPATVTVKVTAVNDAPVANDDTAVTSEDTPVVIAVKANDADVENDALTAQILTQPVNGKVARSITGALVYTPKANFVGIDTFTYRLYDGKTSAPATVTVTVNPVNDAPVANKETALVLEDTPATLNVLANDKDGDGDALTAQVVTGPANGSAVVNANGTVTYTPNANFNGPDSFTYSAFDGTAASAPTTVTLNVRAVNDAPVANDDTAVTSEDTPVVITVKANDADVENDALTAQILTQPVNGKVARSITGALVYTPKANFVGIDTFTYRLYDGKTSAPATVTVTVNPVNDAPVANKETALVLEDTPATLNVLANDKDGDGDALTAQVVTGPANGSAVVNANGTVTYTPNANFNGPDSFTYSAFDGTAASAPTTVTLNVRAVNDAPIANPDTANTLVNTPVVIDVKANDTDVENNALTPQILTQPINGKVVRNINGTFTYTPKANFVGTDTFTYRLYDGKTSEPTTVTVTVAALGDNIDAVDDSYTALGGVPFSAPFPVTDNDFSATGNPLGEVILVDGPDFATVFSLDADGGFTYTTAPGFTGTDTFTYRVADSVNPAVVSDTATVTITIISPITAEDDGYTVLAGVPFEAPLPVTFNDESATGNPLGEVTLIDGPDRAIAFSLDADGGFTYLTNADFTGTDTFTYRVADSVNPGAVSNVATVTLTIGSPITAEDDGYTVLAGVPFEAPLPVTSNDESATGNPLGEVTLIDGPDRAIAFSLDADGGFTYTTNPDFTGTDTFTYRVADSVNPGAVSNIATVTLTIVSPITANPDNYTAVGGVPFSAPFPVTDNDQSATGNPLGVVTLVDGPDRAIAFDLDADGRFTYTTNPDFTGTDTFTYQVADSVNPGAVSAPTTVTITVVSPITANPDAYTVLAGVPYEAPTPVTFNDSSQTGNPLGEVTLVDGPDHATAFSLAADGGFTYTTNPDFTGTDTFTYRVADSVNPGAVSAPTTVTITVGSGADEIAPARTLAIGGEPKRLAVSADGTRAYVIDASDNSLVVVDLTDQPASFSSLMSATTLMAAAETPLRIHVGTFPTELVVSPDGTRVYVSGFDGNVTVVDAVANRVIDTNPGGGGDADPISLGFLPAGMAISPDGTNLYVTSTEGTSVTVINTLTNQIIDTDPDQPGINPISLSGAGGAFVPVAVGRNKAYVINSEGLHVIDTATKEVIGGPIALEPLSTDVALNRDESRLYIVTASRQALTVIDTATLQAIDTDPNRPGVSPILVAENPIHVVIRGDRAYVLSGSGGVTVVNTLTNTVVDTLNIGFGSDIAISPGGTRIYLTRFINSTFAGEVVELTNSHIDFTSPVVGDPAFTVDDIDTVSGVVIGSVNVTDPDGDPLSYKLVGWPDPSVGTVAVNANTGQWTFTPTGQARLDAYGGGPNTAMFTISAADGQTSVPVAVTTPIDPIEIAVTGVIALENPPVGVAVTPDGGLTYVVDPGPYDDGGRILVIDNATNEVLDDIDIVVGFSPHDIAISPDGSIAYVTHSGDGAVSVIDLATDTVLAQTIPVDFGAYRVRFSPDGAHAYVTSTSGSVAVIDTADHSVEATLPITNTAQGLGVYGNRLYVGNQEFPNAQLTVIDLEDNSQIGVIPLVEDNHLTPQMMAIVGNRGYVPLPGAGVVWVVDLDTNQIIDADDQLDGVNPIALSEGDSPSGIAAHGDRVYVSNSFSETVSVIDTTSNTVIETIDLGFTPVGAVAVSPDGSRIYVTAADFSDLEDYDGVIVVLSSARSSAAT